MLPPYEETVPPVERTAVLPRITDTFEPPLPAPPAAPSVPPAPTAWAPPVPAKPLVAPVAVPAPVPAAPAAAQAPMGLGAGPRGRILVVEGGYGGAGRRPWARTGGSAAAPVLSAMLAAVSPQILLNADAVDAVHLPGAADPQSVLAHLRAAARHPGPLLIHLGGHLVTDRRGDQLFLTLRDSKAGSARQDSLPWQAIAEELRPRPAEWDTLVIADLSADQACWPQLQSSISPLKDGLPLWAAVSPDPDRIGTFTRALIEALHGGRPGAGPVLAPEQLNQQVHSVLRPDVIIFSSYPSDRPVFRNTARVLGDGKPEPKPWDGPRPSAVMPKPANRTARQRPAGGRGKVLLSKAAPTEAPARPPHGPVTLAKAGVPPTPPRPARPVSLLKVSGAAASSAGLAGPAGFVSLAKPGVPETRREVGPGVSLAKRLPQQATAPAAPVVEQPLSEQLVVEQPAPEQPDYREVIGRIVRSADAGEHQTATELALELEQLAVSTHGPLAPEVLQVRQVRAHVSRLAGLPAVAAELYREVAVTLLRSEGPEHPETQRAATNAEACWRAVTDRAEAIRLAPEIIELRAHLPGPDGRKLRASERYLKQLVAAHSEGIG